ncbi:MAG: DNA replication/repair protein RecF [Lachnospiraceae bacterium]|nr:DNA replication/repair protein RecF [Lachnospiraceae bacterium]
MRIDSLKLKNFRNYEYLKIDLDPKINIFYGDNAAGKTNILEAIYLCGTTKSHRGAKDKELIRLNEDEAHIGLEYEKRGVAGRIDFHLKRNAPKGIAINRIPIYKASELFGLLSLVFFSPEDLNIIKNGPSERRRFLDIELSALNRIYLHQLYRYLSVVHHRNALLKDIDKNEKLLKTLDIWDEQLVQYGVEIENYRIDFIEKINDIISYIHMNLTSGKESLHLSYESSHKGEQLKDAVFNLRERDLRQKNTMVGPHRDDICFSVNGLDIRKYGSQGQQRTAALSLKLAEIELVKRTANEIPILLLDDVLSELDRNRQQDLLYSIHDTQTLLTCTGLDEFIQSKFTANKIFKVNNAQVENELI